MSDTGIEALEGESNFYVWKAAIKLHLESLDLWNITSGAAPRPTTAALDTSNATPTPTTAQQEWDRASILAMCFLARHMSEKVNNYALEYDTAPEVWQALMRAYLQRNANSLLKSFHAVCSLRYSDTSGESFADYLASFGRHWDDLLLRTEDADPPTVGSGNSLETAMRVIATSDESKMEFLTSSLPESLSMFVMNLKFQLGAELTYFRLYRELMSFHKIRELQNEEDALERSQSPDCTWCRSRGFESEGHLWKQCELLQEIQKQKR